MKKFPGRVKRMFISGIEKLLFSLNQRLGKKEKSIQDKTKSS